MENKENYNTELYNKDKLILQNMPDKSTYI